MRMRLSRRPVLFGAAAALLQLRIVGMAGAGIAEATGTAGAAGTAGVAGPAPSSDANERIAELEKREGGRLGVAVLDTGSARRWQHRADERFALCSTFKYLAASAILKRVEEGRLSLDQWVAFSQRDLLEYAPVTRLHVREGGMTLADVCAAAVEMSDNTAGNLLLQILGGPAGLTRYCRSLGDDVTRLDRTEPELNRVAPGDSRDTTSPAAMVKLLDVIFRGRALSKQSRLQLQSWMIAAKVGQQRIPAGLPPDWRVGHKTGTGPDEANDVAIAWPPRKAPIFIAAFYARAAVPQERQDAVLREVGSIVASAI